MCGAEPSGAEAALLTAHTAATRPVRCEPVALGPRPALGGDGSFGRPNGEPPHPLKNK